MDDTAAALTDRIVTFVRSVGITIEPAILPDDGFLPAIAVRNGVLLYDPARLQWPGDLLHEAGHIAVTDPALRPTVSEFDSDGGDEMAAIAWSYAAARAAGIDSRTLFHDHGYKGEGGWLAELFDGGGDIGVPMLQYYGICARAGQGEPTFPAIRRWLR
ncbi:hypothetical protein [Sphingomonas bacterium]|uniref:hypothetical protein n=1 Tax=Sphingomonas bacterium TaxID=1895847 RepID=UPI00260308F5|nr:hypothetical protein [Sphingomonas bacterium]MDB5678715.1 hypothetical protein [Sphingomonas bacterium]